MIVLRFAVLVACFRVQSPSPTQPPKSPQMLLYLFTCLIVKVTLFYRRFCFSSCTFHCEPHGSAAAAAGGLGGSVWAWARNDGVEFAVTV